MLECFCWPLAVFFGSARIVQLPVAAPDHLEATTTVEVVTVRALSKEHPTFFQRSGTP